MMTQQDNGTYTHTAFIDGTVWFVLADGLADHDMDWDTFNSTMRIGPLNGDETITANEWVTTQKAGGDHGAYKFVGNGSECTITYIPDASRFIIEGVYVWPPIEYTVAGAPATVFGTEWDLDNSDNRMTKRHDGIYELRKYNCLLAGNHEIIFKVVRNHDWANAWPDENFVVFYAA